MESVKCFKKDPTKLLTHTGPINIGLHNQALASFTEHNHLSPTWCTDPPTVSGVSHTVLTSRNGLIV